MFHSTNFSSETLATMASRDNNGNDNGNGNGNGDGNQSISEWFMYVFNFDSLNPSY